MTPCYGAFAVTTAGAREWNASVARCSPVGPGSSSPERSDSFGSSSGRLQHPGELDEGLRLLEELLVVEETGDIRKASLCLGHASIQSTEIYLRRDPTGKLDVLAARLPPVNRKGSFKEAPDRLLAILKDARAQ